MGHQCMSYTLADLVFQSNVYSLTGPLTARTLRSIGVERARTGRYLCSLVFLPILYGSSLGLLFVGGIAEHTGRTRRHDLPAGGVALASRRTTILSPGMHFSGVDLKLTHHRAGLVDPYG